MTKDSKEGKQCLKDSNVKHLRSYYRLFQDGKTGFGESYMLKNFITLKKTNETIS